MSLQPRVHGRLYRFRPLPTVAYELLKRTRIIDPRFRLNVQTENPLDYFELSNEVNLVLALLTAYDSEHNYLDILPKELFQFTYNSDKELLTADTQARNLLKSIAHDIAILKERAQPFTAQYVSQSAPLDVTIDLSAANRPRALIEIYYETDTASSFTLYVSVDNANWIQKDKVDFAPAGRRLKQYQNAFPYLRIVNEIEGNHYIIFAATAY